MRGLIGVLLIIMIILISGCTETGMVADTGLTPEEELVLEGFLNDSGHNETEAASVYAGNTGPQNITQPRGCPGTCDDGDGCTYDYCSRDTGYECVHAARICPNFVKICPDGVEVVCENTCLDNSCTGCEPDCSEHQLPVCDLTGDDYAACQVLDTENCECAQITSCVDNDGCCPGGCSHASDNDCEEPECNESWECTEWSECMNGAQSRECNDMNSCGTEEAKPDEMQECEPETSDVTITYVDYAEEWVEIANSGTIEKDMTNWTINDTLASPREVFRFPRFILQPGSHVYILKGYGENNATHLYRNNSQNVWNNDGDTAVLIDSMGQIISQYSYV